MPGPVFRLIVLAALLIAIRDASLRRRSPR
jgi:hypothetical protein